MKRLTKHAWIGQIFKTKAASTGGIIRRKTSNVIKHGSVDELKDECAKRGFHLIINGDYFIIFCNSDHFIVL